MVRWQSSTSKCLKIIHFFTGNFYQVEAEEQPEISEAYGVTAVPYFVFCKVWSTTIVLFLLLVILLF